MRILYLIGNGFDINVGLKTSYQEFLKFYLEQPIPKELDYGRASYIKNLKQRIQENIQLWSDFEIQFGKHMSNLGGMGSATYSIEEEFDIINDDIRVKLSSYVAEEDKRISFSGNAPQNFLTDIVIPEQHLRDFEKKDIDYKKNNSNTSNVVDIISFNYTRTIEKLLSNNSIVKSNGFDIHEPAHVHGFYDNRMILGVNDISQIDNEKMRKNRYAINSLVKSNCNRTYGVSHTNQCENLIEKAQLICCYGLSFGDTDKIWWKKICQELQNRQDLIVIIFWHVDQMKDYSNDGPKLEKERQQVITKFLKQGGLGESVFDSLSNRIYVSINAPIFKIHIDENESYGMVAKMLNEQFESSYKPIG